MTDTMTILTSTGPALAKTWRGDGTIQNYRNAKIFSVSAERVWGIEGLARCLAYMTDDPHSCVIRGRFVGDDLAREQEADMRALPTGQALRRASVFKDVPHHWVCLDVDDFEPLTADPLQDTEGAINEFIYTSLPAEFQGVSYFWQLSGSAGHPTKGGTLRCHLWFWMDKPADSAGLKAWAKATQVPIDTGLFSAVQIHYTADPLFDEGMADPVERRHGLVDGERSTVVALALPDVPTVHRDAPTHNDDLAFLEATPDVLDDLRSALGLFDPDGYDDWVRTGLGLYCLGEPGRALWSEWSARSGKFDTEQAAAKWSTFDRAQSDHRAVFAEAQRRGWVNPRSTAAQHKRWREEAEAGDHADLFEHRPPIMEVPEMLSKLVFIAEGAAVAFIDQPRFALPFAQFKALTAASVSIEGEGKAKRKVRHAEAWLTSPDRITVHATTFAPGQPTICTDPEGRKALNTWRPAHQRVPDNWAELAQPFFEHVAYLVPDHAERERFLDWLAHIQQRPGELSNVHYLMVARQTGIGRNWLGYASGKAFPGYTALGFDLADTLRTGFNGRLGGKLLAVVDELHEGGPGGASSRTAEKLKSMLTEQTRLINPKYGHQRMEFNTCRFLMFSNHDAALPLAGNDRRIAVIENPAERRPASYYAELYALLDNPDFGPALAHALQQRDIHGFNAGEVAPMNAAKQRVIRAGRSEIEQAVRDIAADWPSDCMTAAALNDEVRDALGQVGSTQGAGVAAGLVKFGRVKIDGTPCHVWILRNTSRWIGALPREVAEEVLRGRVAAETDLSMA